MTFDPSVQPLFDRLPKQTKDDILGRRGGNRVAVVAGPCSHHDVMVTDAILRGILDQLNNGNKVLSVKGSEPWAVFDGSDTHTPEAPAARYNIYISEKPRVWQSLTADLSESQLSTVRKRLGAAFHSGEPASIQLSATRGWAGPVLDYVIERAA